MSESYVLLVFILIVLVAGLVFIEFRTRGKAKDEKPHGERRKTRKVQELEPLGPTMLTEVKVMLEKDQLITRDGLKFIIRMMSELYVADMQRTYKVNELVEQVEIIRNKSVLIWIEHHPKRAWALMVIAAAMLIPEIRQPLFAYAFSLIGINIQ